jgi:hypothetical protein
MNSDIITATLQEDVLPTLEVLLGEEPMFKVSGIQMVRVDGPTCLMTTLWDKFGPAVVTVRPTSSSFSHFDLVDQDWDVYNIGDLECRALPLNDVPKTVVDIFYRIIKW